MDEQFVYRCTRLDGTGKEGVLKPDENGYYTICLGALDHSSRNVAKDSKGNYFSTYYSSEGASKFFGPGTMFNERIRGGHVKCEYGHPKKDGMDPRQFLERNMQIDERMVCATIGEIWLVPNYKDPLTGEMCVGIFGKVKPSGPYGKYLEEDLKSKGMNVCFSIRSLTTWKMINGRQCKVLHTVITFDYVIEPGITCAEKLLTPSLESRQFDFSHVENADIDFNLTYAESILRERESLGLSTESSDAMVLREALDSYKIETDIRRSSGKIRKAFNL